MNRKPPYFVMIVCMAILLILSAGACYAKKTDDGKKPPEKAADARAVKTDIPFTAYGYNPRGKADPFKPFMETDPNVIEKRAEMLKRRKKADAAALPDTALSPLQREEIDKFILVGIAGDQTRRTAIVEDKGKNRHYPLFVGTYIGKNGGRVEAIHEDRVIVREIVPDGPDGDIKDKKRHFNRIEMLLHKDR